MTTSPNKSLSLLPKFAYLPNGIIREIVAYTGAIFKCRNGKYMGQIPKNDPRYALLHKIPPKNIVVGQQSPYTYFSSTALLFKEDRFDVYTIRLQVSGLIWGEEKKTSFSTRLMVCDGNSPVRYYEYDEDVVSFKKKMDEVGKMLDEFKAKMKISKQELTFWRGIVICSSVYLAHTIIKAFWGSKESSVPT